MSEPEINVSYGNDYSLVGRPAISNGFPTSRGRVYTLLTKVIISLIFYIRYMVLTP